MTESLSKTTNICWIFNWTLRILEL